MEKWTKRIIKILLIGILFYIESNMTKDKQLKELDAALDKFKELLEKRHKMFEIEDKLLDHLDKLVSKVCPEIQWQDSQMSDDEKDEITILQKGKKTKVE